MGRVLFGCPVGWGRKPTSMAPVDLRSARPQNGNARQDDLTGATEGASAMHRTKLLPRIIVRITITVKIVMTIIRR
jgi:hypothetical protein